MWIWNTGLSPVHCPYLDVYFWLVQHDGLLSLMVICDLLVDGDGWHLDQPVGGDRWSITLILQSEGHAPFCKNHNIPYGYTIFMQLHQGLWLVVFPDLLQRAPPLCLKWIRSCLPIFRCSRQPWRITGRCRSSRPRSCWWGQRALQSPSPLSCYQPVWS